MPKYQINFQVDKHHTNGSIEVAAPSQDAAIELVENMDIDQLIEHTDGVEWTVEAWPAEEA